MRFKKADSASVLLTGVGEIVRHAFPPIWRLTRLRVGRFPAIDYRSTLRFSDGVHDGLRVLAERKFTDLRRPIGALAHGTVRAGRRDVPLSYGRNAS